MAKSQNSLLHIIRTYESNLAILAEKGFSSSGFQEFPVWHLFIGCVLDRHPEAQVK
jgi:hypothetical protein